MFILYLALSIRAFIKSFVFSRSILRENPFVLAILSILIFMIAGCVLDIMALIFNSRLFMEFALIILNLVIVTLFFILFRFPEYGKKIKKIVQHETQKRSYLKGVDVRVLETKINQLIQEEEIFTDENLTLDSMAEKLNISRHQLSELLNKKLGENFSSFIKKYRIKKAKQLLIEYPDMNILNIAFDVGFKSKSTFNDAFSKLERTTPAQFRKQKLK
ncbi:MAG: AraC family transcriptional regulator [Desulfobacteraceae bacterium]|nr:AraC family transcriptional regulator [Desulfobacteraceae bacterium]